MQLHTSVCPFVDAFKIWVFGSLSFISLCETAAQNEKKKKYFKYFKRMLRGMCVRDGELHLLRFREVCILFEIKLETLNKMYFHISFGQRRTPYCPFPDNVDSGHVENLVSDTFFFFFLLEGVKNQEDFYQTDTVPPSGWRQRERRRNVHFHAEALRKYY